MKPLTHQEKAAIYLHLCEGVADRCILYAVAVGTEKANKLTESSLKTMASNWFKSHRVQSFLKEAKQTREREENEIKEKERTRVETEASQAEREKANPDAVNFLNPEEFLKFANQQANEIKDEKERREYLKMIANLMNYKEADQETNEIQRFYTPILCESCEIYRKCSNCSGAGCCK